MNRGSERIGHGLVRTAGGRIREMTVREIDQFADEMTSFSDLVSSFLPSGPLTLGQHLVAILRAEDADEEARA